MVSSEAKRAALRDQVSFCVSDLAFVEKLVHSLRQSGDFKVTTSATQDATAVNPNPAMASSAAGEMTPSNQERESVPYRNRRWSLTAVNPVNLLRTNKGSQVQIELAEVVPGEAIIAGSREQRQIQYRLVAALNGVSIIFGVGATWLAVDSLDRLPSASIEQAGVQPQVKGEPVKPGVDARGTGDANPIELVECSGSDLSPGGNGCLAAARQTGVASTEDKWFDFDQ